MKFAVILAGGSGLRAGGGVPKQFRMLRGRPVVWWSMKAFHDADPGTRLVLVMHPGFFDDWDLLLADMPENERLPHALACGGRDRRESVANGLLTVSEILDGSNGSDGSAEEILVAVHDGARPLVTAEMIRRGWEGCVPGVCRVPVVDCVDSLRRYDAPEERDLPLSLRSSRNVSRAGYVAVQTPQVFTLSDIGRAHRLCPKDGNYTDDASMAEAQGIRVSLFEGDPRNLKITRAEDLRIAEILMA